MTREKQIMKLIDEEMGVDNYGSSDYQVGVCDGVRLADKTMIEKIKNYLRENIILYCYSKTVDEQDDWFNKFSKAMEE